MCQCDSRRSCPGHGAYRTSLALSHPISHWDPLCPPQGFQWKSRDLQEGSKGWRPDPKPKRCRGKDPWEGEQLPSPGIPVAPPTSLHPRKIPEYQHLEWNLPWICHSPSELKGTKPLRYKLMLKLFVKHLKFSVTYFKYPPCSPEGGSKPNTNWEPMGGKGRNRERVPYPFTALTTKYQ